MDQLLSSHARLNPLAGNDNMASIIQDRRQCIPGQLIRSVTYRPPEQAIAFRQPMEIT